MTDVRATRSPGSGGVAGLRAVSRPERRWPSTRGVARFFGPGFVAAVAYVDPGNFATNVMAGARYRFALLWVVFVANAIAMLVQHLSAKLGIATGASLPQLCRARFGRRARIVFWWQAELVVAMTEMAEVVGGALALNMLVGLPLAAGAVLVTGVSLLVMALRSAGRRGFEAVVAGMLAVVLAAFVYQTSRAHLSAGQAVGGLRPDLPGHDGVLLAVGIVGATVMPHTVYLHSALTSELAPDQVRGERRTGVRASAVDVVVALGFAALVNAAILMAATPLGRGAARSLNAAYLAFAASGGRGAATVFALALLASGLAASCVGGYSGQIVMEGLLRRSLPVWQRRLWSVVPALAVLLSGLDPSRALLVSQVVVSFGVPFAVVPLAVFTADRRLMGELVNRRATVVATIAAVALVTLLNGYLVLTVVR